MAATGKFVSDSPATQLALATETHIRLFDVSQGEFRPLTPRLPVQATITAMCSVPGARSADRLLVLSDSGNPTLLEYTPSTGQLAAVAAEPLCRSGVRRASPQQFAAADPSGACVFLTAAQTAACMYQLGSDSSNNNTPTLGSPIDAPRPECVTLALAACSDAAYPTFATLELELAGSDTGNNGHGPRGSTLAFYTLEPNLHTVVRSHTRHFHGEASFLVALPGGVPGNPRVALGFPGHVVVTDMQGELTIELPLPGRSDVVVAGAATPRITLLQTADGQLLKLVVGAAPDARGITPASLRPFDMLQVCTALHILPSGHLAAVPEWGDVQLLQFESLGEDQDESESESNSDSSAANAAEPQTHTLTHLARTGTLPTLNPLTAARFDATTLSVLCPAVQPHSTTPATRTLRSTVPFHTVVASPLPPSPQRLWALRASTSAPHHSLLVLAFPRATKTLAMADDAITELAPGPFPGGETTLHCALLQGDTLVQVTPGRVTQVQAAAPYAAVSEWLPPAGVRCVCAASTPTQLAVALSNGTVAYFIADAGAAAHGALLEAAARADLGGSAPITALAMGGDAKAGVPALFLAVATGDKLLSTVALHPDSASFLERTSYQRLGDVAVDVVCVPGEVHCGLRNGVYARSTLARGPESSPLDPPVFVDVTNRYLGGRPVSLSLLPGVALENVHDSDSDSEEEDEDEEDEAPVETHPCVVAHSEETWTWYASGGREYLRQVSLPEGIGALLRAAEVHTAPLPANGCVALSRTGQLVIGRFGRFPLASAWFAQQDSTDASEDEDEDETVAFPQYRTKCMLPMGEHTVMVENHIGKTHASRFSILSPVQNEPLPQPQHTPIPFGKCTAATLVEFSSGGSHLVVATGGGTLHTYALGARADGTFAPRLLHSTETNEAKGQAGQAGSSISALASFRGMLLASVHRSLVLFALGKKQLLRRFAAPLAPSAAHVTCLAVRGDALVAAGDLRESVTVYRHSQAEGDPTFFPVACDSVSRHVTALAFLDDWTLAGGDRAGNVWCLRVPPAAHAPLGEADSPAQLWRRREDKRLGGNLMEAPFRLELANHFYLNDIVTSLAVVRDVQRSGRELLVYTGLQGSIGVLVPVLSSGEARLLRGLEGAVERLEESADAVTAPEDVTVLASRKVPAVEGRYTLVGRDHSSYRGYYAPVRNVIDGDLCETFFDLPPLEQRLVCAAMPKATTPEAVRSALNLIRIDNM
ncbi:U2 snRNP complex subunit [Maudiozyma humilis]|uniref:U2 snRNP complex subunit n=1 Tax=Maudiozyma humilis TaxID=51915 RepID=A0AAV5S3P3_MAUHU|nr:U2 snRNP complex subunit [Kazachstania humilis]